MVKAQGTSNTDAQYDYGLYPFGDTDLIGANWNYVVRIGADMKRKWSVNLAERPYFLGVGKDYVIASCYYRIFKLNAINGSIIWQRTKPNGALPGILDNATGQWMYCNKSTGAVTCLDANGNAKWETKKLNGMTAFDFAFISPSGDGTTITVVANNTLLAHIRISDGTIVDSSSYSAETWGATSSAFEGMIFQYGDKLRALKQSTLASVWTNEKNRSISMGSDVYVRDLAFSSTLGLGVVQNEYSSGKPSEVRFIDLKSGKTGKDSIVGPNDFSSLSTAAFSGDYLYLTGIGTPTSSTEQYGPFVFNKYQIIKK